MEYACYEVSGQTDKAPTHGTYPTLKAMYDAGCRSPGVIFERIGGPTCWDGVHVDSPDHRSHVARVLSSTVTTYYNYWDGTNNIPKNTQWAQCPATHPVVIPDVELQLFYVLDAAWDAGQVAPFLRRADEYADGCRHLSSPRLLGGMVPDQ
jgi:hypothetical protein